MYPRLKWKCLNLLRFMETPLAEPDDVCDPSSYVNFDSFCTSALLLHFCYVILNHPVYINYLNLCTNYLNINLTAYLLRKWIIQIVVRFNVLLCKYFRNSFAVRQTTMYYKIYLNININTSLSKGNRFHRKVIHLEFNVISPTYLLNCSVISREYRREIVTIDSHTMLMFCQFTY